MPHFLDARGDEKQISKLERPKVTLFTIDTEFLASRLNVIRNERNLMFDFFFLNMNMGVPLKGSKRVLMGQKS